MNSHRAFAFLLVFLGGGLGSILRHAVNEKGPILWGVNYPWSTVFVNIAGSLAMGLIAGWFALRGHSGQLPRLFLTTGILGGFTTFSTFSLDGSLLLERGDTLAGMAYIVGSVVAGILALFAGLMIMRSILS
ncbi:MAG TPA: fluoride efflux transporter CrcB [Bryobacteraceae bacterium]|nr:fluoride efflux transporter CrcB [Bryobacteraceae bacterium]HVY94042.1 fluoride efflux transporter CrcB [Bryobacteraceae bacterium]